MVFWELTFTLFVFNLLGVYLLLYLVACWVRYVYFDVFLINTLMICFAFVVFMCFCFCLLVATFPLRFELLVAFGVYGLIFVLTCGFNCLFVYT